MKDELREEYFNREDRKPTKEQRKKIEKMADEITDLVIEDRKKLAEFDNLKDKLSKLNQSIEKRIIYWSGIYAAAEMFGHKEKMRTISELLDDLEQLKAELE